MKIYVYLLCVLLAAMPFFSAWLGAIMKRFQKPQRRMTHYAEMSREYTRQGLQPIPVKSRQDKR